ncbi:MAG: LysR family transcriptional regulator [Synergistaceae bacterium]|nr:LysR family transcriptional regulator [Synergistaceae bacterium]
MNLSSINTFLEISRTKNIAKAAYNLFLAQSTVSLQIKTLENELGITLFERHKGKRQLELTQKGRDFIPIAERLIQIFKEAYALRYEDKLSLSVSCVDSLNLYCFAPFYKKIKDVNSPINLRILTHQSNEIYEQVENRLVDIGLVLRQSNYRNVIAQPLFKEKMAAVFSQRINPPSKAVHPRDLNFKQEILLNWGPEFSQWHDRWCTPDVSPAIQVDNVAILLDFLIDGEYWSILPHSVIRKCQQTVPLKTCALIDMPPDRVCYKLTHRFPVASSIPSIRFFEQKLYEYIKDFQI